MKQYACKIFDKNKLRKTRKFRDVGGKKVWSNALQGVEREVALMKKLSHPNICTMHEVIDDDENATLYLIMDYMQKGQVMDFDNKSKSYKGGKGKVLDVDTARKYFRDLIQGMEYLHMHLVAHRDLKPENLLVNAADVLNIADFGVANLFEGMTTEGPDGTILRGSGNLSQTEGTFHFMAPECGEDGEFSAYEVDIWAMGVCLYCFVFGKLPFWSDNITEIFDIIKEKEIEIPSGTSPALRILLLRCV